MKNPLLFLIACLLGQTIVSMEPTTSKRGKFTLTIVPNGSCKRIKPSSNGTTTFIIGAPDFSEQLTEYNAKMGYTPKPVKRAQTPDTNAAQSSKKITPEITTTDLLKKCAVFSRGGVTLIPMKDNVS